MSATSSSTIVLICAALIAAHAGIAAAHHAKTGDNEVYGLVQAGLATDRPAAGVAKRWYFATDTLILSRDNGASWVEMARGETAIRLAQLAEKAHSSLTGIGTSDHHIKTTAGELNLADLAEKAHSSLTGVGTSDHHAKTADNEVYGLFAAGLASARPAAGAAGRVYFSTDTLVLERDTGAAWVEMARGETAIRLAQLSEKAHGSLTGVSADQHHAQAHTLASHSTKAHSELTGVGTSDHHAKYTDSEAQTTVKANVEVGDLKAPTKALPSSFTSLLATLNSVATISETRSEAARLSLE
ncbi:hypothetical protein ES703_100640 [subsurface metagenome]